MPRTICQQCRTREVTIGRYMCRDCEDQMTGRTRRKPPAQSHEQERTGGAENPEGESGDTASASAHCRRCGAPMENGDVFCAACGGHRAAGTAPAPKAASPSSSSRHCASCGVGASDDDYYCPGCGAVLPTRVAPPPKSRAPLFVGAALIALVALVWFVSSQHQAIVAQGRTSEAAHQRWLTDEARLQAPPSPPPAAPAPLVLAPPRAYVPPTTVPANDQSQPIESQARSSMPTDDFYSPRSVAERDRADAEQQMRTAMEPKHRAFPPTPEGEKDYEEWHSQVMEDRAQTVSQIQQRIDHDNDVISGH